MITPEQFLVDKKLLNSTDLETRFNLRLTRDFHIESSKQIVNALKEYAIIYHNEHIKDGKKC